QSCTVRATTLPGDRAGPGRADGAPVGSAPRRRRAGVPGRRVAGAGPRVERAASAEALDDGGVGHATALAHRLQAVAPTGALELVEQGGQQLRARAPERVAEGDGAAVDVGLGRVGAGLL